MGDTSVRPAFRLSAALLLVGQLLYIAITQFHTGGDANYHPAIFAAYAGSGLWTAVHLGQFAAMAILLAGLLALFFGLDALNVQAGTARWAGRCGAAAAVAALALYGALQAVDGVANKQADVAWARPGRREVRSLCERRGNPLGRVGDEELPQLRAGSRVAPVRGRGRAGSFDPTADRLLDGDLRPHLPGAGLAGRLRGLLTNGVDLHRAGLGPEPGVDDLAGRRLADARFGAQPPG